MNKTVVNKNLSIIKAIPVVLGLGVLTYELVGTGVSMIRTKRLNNKINNLGLELCKLISPDCGPDNVNQIINVLHTYSREKDTDYIIAMLKEYSVHKNNRQCMIDHINNSLNIK